MLSGHFSTTTLKPPNGNRANLWIPIVRALTLSLPFNSDDEGARQLTATTDTHAMNITAALNT